MSALILGSRRDLKRSLSSALARASCASVVERAFDEPPSHDSESVVLDDWTPASIERACLGKRWVFLLDDPIDPTRASERTLAVCRGVRASRATRLIILSDALTLASGGRERTHRDRIVPGTAPNARAEALYVMERTIARMSADGMHCVLALPGYVLRSHERNALAGDADEGARVSVVDDTTLCDVLVRMARSGRAGGRYTLGRHDTTVGRLRAWLGARDMLGAAHEDQLDATLTSGWLSNEDASRDLGLEKVGELDDVLQAAT